VITRLSYRPLFPLIHQELHASVRVQCCSSPLHVSECFSRGTSSTASTPTTEATVRPSRTHPPTSRRRAPLRATATALRHKQAVVATDETKTSSGPVLTSAGRDAWTSRRLVRHRPLPRRHGRTCGGGGSFHYPKPWARRRRLSSGGFESRRVLAQRDVAFAHSQLATTVSTPYQ
jgi:hypothetical protein